MAFGLLSLTVNTENRGFTSRRSVVVVEDNALMRALIANLLESSGFDVQTAANAADAKRAVRNLDPDAVVIDINLGDGPDGFDLAQTLRKITNELAVVFLTSHPDPRFTGRDEGAVVKNAVYLNKTMLTGTDALLEALEAALLDRNTSHFRHDQRADRPLAKLSNSQMQVLNLISQGKTNQQIAVERQRSLKATESLISRTLAALGLDQSVDMNTRVAAAVRYLSEIQL